MSWICYVGIEASAKTQYFLLAAEIITLFLFAVVALWKVYTSDPVGLDPPVAELAQPAQHLVEQRPRRGGACRDLHLLGLGLDGQRQRGDRGLVAHARRRGDPEHDHPRRHLRRRRDRRSRVPRPAVPRRTTPTTCWARSAKDVFGSPLDKLLIIAVLTSASASTQTTILPSTRTALSMAVQGAFPKRFASVHPKHHDTRRGNDLDGRALDHLVRRADAREPERPLRLDPLDRDLHPHLLRDDRVRVRLVLPPRADQEHEALPARRRRPARRGGRR